MLTINPEPHLSGSELSPAQRQGLTRFGGPLRLKAPPYSPPPPPGLGGTASPASLPPALRLPRVTRGFTRR